jgi:hypothetical protein
MREMSRVSCRLYGCVFAAALSVGCGESETCDNAHYAVAPEKQTGLGFSSEDILSANAESATEMRWLEDLPSWFEADVSGDTRAHFRLEMNDEPFEANNIDECRRYLGTPVSASFNTEDGAILATGTGEVRAYEEKELEFRLAFPSRLILGSIHPTNDVDLVVRTWLKGGKFTGQLYARVTRQTESSLSVNQVQVGEFGEFEPLLDAGAPAPDASPSATEQVILPPAPSAPADAAASDGGGVPDTTLDASDGSQVPDATLDASDSSEVPDATLDLSDTGAVMDANQMP